MASKKEDGELRKARSENRELRREVSRLRKKLGKFTPVEEDDESTAAAVVTDEKDDAAKCPNCSADITSLTTPNKSLIYFCKAKCGYRRKAS